MQSGGEFQIAMSPSEMGIRAGRNRNGRAAQKASIGVVVLRGSGSESETERKKKNFWQAMSGGNSVLQLQMAQRWVLTGGDVSLPDLVPGGVLWSRWAATRV